MSSRFSVSFILAGLFVCGCHLSEHNAASKKDRLGFPVPLKLSDVPLPVITPFEGQDRMREAFLDGYRTGYRFAAVGTVISNFGWAQTPEFMAGQRGIDDGQRDGTKAFIGTRLPQNGMAGSAKQELEDLEKSLAELSSK